MSLTRRPRDAGVSAIELAFVAPALLILIFTTIQVGLWLYGRNVALEAAREGVSELRLVQPTDDVGAARARVTRLTDAYARRLGGGALLDPRVRADYDLDTGRVDVRVQARTVTLVPGLSLRVTRSAGGEIERFEPDR